MSKLFVCYRSICLGVAAVCVLAMSAAYAADEGVSLRPQWRAGQHATYSFWNQRDQDVSMTVRGKTQGGETKMVSEGEMTWEVKRVKADGSSTCILTLSWMTVMLEGPAGGVQKMDSRKGSGDNPMFQDLLKAMVGVPLTVEVGSDGVVKKLTGIAAMKKKAKEPKLLPKELDFIETATEIIGLPGAPEQPKAGKGWKLSQRWAHEMGHMNHATAFKFEGVADTAGIPVATVAYTSKPKLEIDRSQLPKGGPPMDVKLLKGAVNGEVLYDLARHEVVGRNSTDEQTIRMQFKLPSGVIERKTVQTIRGQLLRIAEGG